MAVEVVSKSKRLHRHALPLVMIGMAVLLASTLMLQRYTTESPAEAAIAQGLLSHSIVHVKPSAIGLGRVTLDTSVAPAPAAAPSSVSAASNVGRETQLWFNLEAPAQPQ